MKVLLDLQYLNVATTGIKTYMMELANAAKSYPHPEIEWIFSHDPDKQSRDETFKNPSSKVQRLNYHLDYFRWKEFQLPDLVKKHKPDLLICLDFVSPAASLPCKRMTVIHDAFFWQMPKNYPLWWRKYFLSLISKGLKQDSKIITTTNYAKNALIEHLGNNFPIEVVYQSPKNLSEKRDTSLIENNQLDKSPFFLHIGTFDKRKNLPLLVEAFEEFIEKQNKEFKLVLAGGQGQSAQMNDFPVIQKLISERGLEDKVILPGYISDAQIRSLYENAFAYIFPSENEGFGIPIVESMGVGLPVIHSDQPALLEVGGGAGLVFKKGDLTDLVEKMVLLERDKALREELIQKGLSRSKNFSPQKFIEDFQHLILNAAPKI
ncbi:glycosyltransferase family 1 protein [Algoriphagus sp. SE2]|uniref:glycosyltransferase family 4 protein n=1 Tax=Algoriphagus sp. SE2 TaxID=3141536 RepID=UPI0031CD11F7